jgi:hypothetical protein
MNTVVCLKVGTKYGVDYVTKLASMVSRHTTQPTQFVCITDDPEALPYGMDSILAMRQPYLKGWWHKVALFGGYKFDSERIVFLDLDTVIVGNIDFLFDYQGDFAILRDFYYPLHQYGSAIMSIAKTAHRQVWDRFCLNPLKALQAGPGDQDWIRACVDKPDFWQALNPRKCVSYKCDVQGRGVPDDAAIVCFHGQPRPHQVDEAWVEESWR